MAQARAKTGGEIGANGEWYQGGKFIATTDHAKKHGSGKKGTRRQQTECRVWEVPPEEGMRAIFGMYSGIWEHLADGTVRCRDLPVEYWGAEFLDEVQRMADAWNAGERWIKVAK